MPIKITDTEFLGQCGIAVDDASTKLVHKFRRDLALFTSVKGLTSDTLLPSHRIVSDLKLHHMDSLDLVDFTLEITPNNYNLPDSALHEIDSIQSRDGSVEELFVELHSQLEKLP